MHIIFGRAIYFVTVHSAGFKDRITDEIIKSQAMFH